MARTVLPMPSRGQRLLGLVFLLTTCAAWIGASFITQLLVSPTTAQGLQIKPWLLTLICSSCFTIYLPLLALQSACTRRRQGQGQGRRQPGGIAASAAPTPSQADTVRTDEEQPRVGLCEPLLGNASHAAPDAQIREGAEEQGQRQGKDRVPAGSARSGSGDTAGDTEPCIDSMGGGLTPQLKRHVLGTAALVFPLWFAAQYAFSASLALTSVTSNTVLSSTSALFTYMAAVVFMGEAATCGRLACVLAAVGGTVLVTLADTASKQDGGDGGGGLLPQLMRLRYGGGGMVSGGSSEDGDDGGSGMRVLAGDALTLAAAGLYALYTVVMARRLKHDSAEVTALFFGYLGALSACLALPVVAGLWLAGSPAVVHITLPALGLALIQGIVDYVIADYTWARAVLLLGPTAVSCGLALQIPAAALLDVILHGLSQLPWAATALSLSLFSSGSVVIVGGFVGVSTVSFSSQAQQPRQPQQ